MLIRFQKRVRAWFALALFSLCMPLSGCATTTDEEVSAFSPNADFAIYLARVEKQKFMGLLDCPEGYICMSSIYDLSLDPVELIAGNPRIGKQTFRVAQHTAYRSNLLLMVHAKRGKDGAWELLDRRSVDLAACLGQNASEDAEILEDADSDWYIDKDLVEEEVCLRRLYLDRPATAR